MAVNVLVRLSATIGLLFAAHIVVEEDVAFAQAPDADVTDLGAALTAFARINGLQLIYVSKLVEGLKAPNVPLGLSPTATLDKLLAGSGLKYRFVNPKTVTIYQATAPVSPRAAPQTGGQSKLAPPEITLPAPPPVMTAGPAESSKAEPSSTATAPEEIVITGTRIIRSGYQVPTLIAVVSNEQIQAAAPENIADLINQLPLLAGSTTPLNSNLSFSNGQAGLNTLNLRDLGADRTLVLLDGQRSVPSTITGLVDINDFPQQLITRVDIVTGGASAVYGSDAVAGVVNFILDKTFTGLKGEVDGGITTYGDDRNWKVDLTGGTNFGDDRGHFLFSGETANKAGIYGVPRAWNNTGALIMNNPAYAPTNGQPQELLVSGAGLSTATLGGIITNTTLRGVAFGPGGAPYQFQYGSIVDDPFMVGGAWASTQANNRTSLDQASNRQSLFTRASYDVTDGIEAFVQLQWNATRSGGWALNQFNIGNILVQAGNPFVPTVVGAAIGASGITAFDLGTNNGDMPPIAFDNVRSVNRYVVGGNGKLDAFDSSWTWDFYWQRGESRDSENGYNVTAKANFSAALDAVKGPNGSIICASSLTNPGNGCVPYDPMGLGVNSEAALQYIFGDGAHPQRDERFVEDVEAATVQGEPFSDWAGPVSIATGLERRREAASGIADVVSEANGWFAGNYLPTFGHYEVTEGFVETVVPLAKDMPWAKELDLNAAIRGTGYSTSGFVTTWKVGATYAPVDGIHLRATHSRDIRAPNLNDLFQAGTANTNNVTDPANNNQVTTYQGLIVGNPNLTPEVADTNEVGVVVQPSFAPGLSASVDYYNIDIRDGIVSVPAQFIVNRCYQGISFYCAAITRGLGAGGTEVITQIRIEEFNAASQVASGLDMEGSYQLHLMDISSRLSGNLNFHILATHYLRNYTNDGIDPPYDTVGQNGESGPPHWSYNGSVTYTKDALNLVLIGRGVSAGVYSLNNYGMIACAGGCPASTLTAPTINNNRIAGAFYLDATVTYKFKEKANNGYDMEAFLNVTNLANKSPPVVASGPGGLPYAMPPTNPTFYDVLGRVFRAGVRFEM